MVDDINIGDYLYCHTDLIMDDDLEVCATSGHRYLVINITNNKLFISNNQQREHCFSFRKEKHSYYKQWFCNLNLERKLKLKNLSKS
jgi:hypothetical protein